MHEILKYGAQVSVFALLPPGLADARYKTNFQRRQEFPAFAVPWCSSTFTANDALGWFSTCDQAREAGHAFDMGLFCAATGLLIGGASIKQLSLHHHRYGNIGYWVRQSQQGRGHARQAVRLLADFGFKQRGPFRLEIVVPVANEASRAVVRASGATLESLARNQVYLRKQSFDAYILFFCHTLKPAEPAKPVTATSP